MSASKTEEHARERHEELHRQVEEAVKDPLFCPLELMQLKRKKLQAKDELTAFESNRAVSQMDCSMAAE